MFSSCSGYGSGAFIAKRSGISTMVDRESFHDFPGGIVMIGSYPRGV